MLATGDYFLNYMDYDFDLSNFEESYISQRVNGRFDGKQLGLPTGIAGPALVVNKELADKYGIDFSQPYTWDQFIEWASRSMRLTLTPTCSAPTKSTSPIWCSSIR